jgi:hypothetical protein
MLTVRQKPPIVLPVDIYIYIFMLAIHCQPSVCRCSLTDVAMSMAIMVEMSGVKDFWEAGWLAKGNAVKLQLYARRHHRDITQSRDRELVDIIDQQVIHKPS